MSKEYSITFYFDTRRKKGKNTFPLKLRLYHPPSTKEKLFRTGYYFTIAEYDQAVKLRPAKGGNKIRKERKAEISEILHVLRNKAELILKNLPNFSFEAFEKRYYNKSAALSIGDYYQTKIEALEQEGRVRTAENYSLSYRRLKGYINLSRIKKLDDIPFEKISVGFLKKYEKYLVNEGCSLATIGIYLRPLRAIFNLAINDPNSGLRESMYPFGKSQYQIPTGQNVKKALSPEQLKTLFESKPENDQQKKAKDFWFFSYLANGMNFKDIAELKYGNLSDNRISFYRAKTQRTTKSNPKLIQAMLPVFALNVIEEYGNKNSKSEDYIFPILSQSDSALQAANKVKDFTRFVNQHIKKLAMENGITDEISTYWARHSFTTQAIRKGASMELLQESLGHKSLSTTQNYFAGFSNDVKQKLSESLLNFD